MAIGETVQTLPDTIGGGRVLRAFSGRARGEVLSAEEVAAIPLKNRQAMTQTGFLHIWPAPARPANTEYHIASSGPAMWDVIEGVKIAQRVDAEEVYRLSGRAVGAVKHRLEEEEKKAAAAD